jgi:predicted aspartyl protease
MFALVLLASIAMPPSSAASSEGQAAAPRQHVKQAATAPGGAYPLRLTTGSRLLVEARVNGTPVQALLDSGAEASLLDTEFARTLGLLGGKEVVGRGSGAGTTKASLASGVTLQAFGLELTDQTVGVMSLSDVGQRLLGHPLPFILGREIFDNARLEIDIEGKTIRVLDAATQPRGVRLDLRTAHGIETMPVLIEGRPAQALFDIGNGSRPLLGGAFADAAGWLKDGRPVTEDAGGGIGGAVQRQIITLRSVELAGKKFENVPVSIDRAEHAHEFNVGVSILRHYLITTDFKARAVWLEPRE